MIEKTTYEKIDALVEMSLEIKADIEALKKLIKKEEGFDPVSMYEEQYLMSLSTHMPSKESMYEVKRKIKLFEDLQYFGSK
jgi:hypothetical protein